MRGAMGGSHRFSFFRAGGVDQVVLRDGTDIANLKDLDKKLWVALACPVEGLTMDAKTLALIDMNKDGRIRVPEILEAVEWCKSVFKSLDLLLDDGSDVALADLNTETELGKAVLSGAKRVLADVGNKKAKKISLVEVEAVEKAIAETRFNGDGIVPADAADEEPLKKAMTDVMDAVGSVVDRSGKPGIDKSLCDRFFAEAADLLAWDDEGKTDGLQPLGIDSALAAAAFAAVHEKITDYFTRCRVAAFDPRAAAALNAAEAELAALTQKQLSGADADLAKLPLSRIEAGRALTLGTGLNPAWVDAMRAFTSKVVGPVLGAERAALSEDDFATIEAKLTTYRVWLAKKPAVSVEKLGIPRLREIVDAGTKAAIEALIEKDLELAADYAAIEQVEKAVRLNRDFVTVLRNFVNFADFYGHRGATFQAGTLFLDARACDLVVRVGDPAKHAVLANLSKAYLAYCDCTRKDEPPMSIAAAFSAGDVDNLMVGRNGVFYDRAGRDWDATITKIIENPISIRQAFWMPYKRLVRLVEEQVAKRAADKEKASAASIDAAALSAASADQTKAPVPAPVPATPDAAAAAAAASTPKKLDIGVIAAISVAVAGIGTFLAMILDTFLDLGWWMPVGILGILLMVSGPSMLIAWLKLRQRNLGPILDANGWAINGRMKINVPFGGSLTRLAELPEGAKRALDDPFAEKPTPWKLYVVLAIVVALFVAWTLGKLDPLLPGSVQSSRLISPAASSAPAPSGAPSAPPAAPPKAP